jgi:signal transduction histidine kinase
VYHDVTDREEQARQLQVFHRVLRHNIANGMNIIRGTAELMADRTTGEDEMAAERIVDEVDQLLGLTEKHRAVVGLLGDRPEPTPRELSEPVREVVQGLRRSHPGMTVELDDPGSTRVLAISKIGLAVQELLTNAVVHSGTDPLIEVAIDRDEETVSLQIADQGPGIPSEEARILTGGQEVDPLHHGVGMGLWLVYWIVNLSEGTITVRDNHPRGSVVSIELQRAGGDDE